MVRVAPWCLFLRCKSGIEPEDGLLYQRPLKAVWHGGAGSASQLKLNHGAAAEVRNGPGRWKTLSSSSKAAA